MDNKSNIILKDILICIENSDNYLDENKIFNYYDTNFLLQDAVERNLITIGGVVNICQKKCLVLRFQMLVKLLTRETS
jgi:uncharacterized protein with HEPN domain